MFVVLTAVPPDKELADLLQRVDGCGYFDKPHNEEEEEEEEEEDEEEEEVEVIHFICVFYFQYMKTASSGTLNVIFWHYYNTCFNEG